MTLEGQRLLARGKSFCRAGEIDGPNPISSLDQAATRSHARCFARPQTRTRSSALLLSTTMDQESLSYWERFIKRPGQPLFWRDVAKWQTASAAKATPPAARKILDLIKRFMQMMDQAVICNGAVVVL